MGSKELIDKLILASDIISKTRKPKANYITVSTEFIEQQADERNISYDDMVEIITYNLK